MIETEHMKEQEKTEKDTEEVEQQKRKEEMCSNIMQMIEQESTEVETTEAKQYKRIQVDMVKREI